jgi:hypothetical protein
MVRPTVPHKAVIIRLYTDTYRQVSRGQTARDCGLKKNDDIISYTAKSSTSVVLWILQADADEKVSLSECLH